MAEKKEKTGRPAFTFEEFVQRPPKLSIQTDHPLTAEQIKKLFVADPFNFRYKLGPIFDILRYGGKGTGSDQMPTAILITGDWGTGKTTAMKWLEVLLEEWNSKKPEKIPAKDYIKVRPVWFYPWKYHDKEDVWRGLLAEVIANSVEINSLTLKRLQYGAICFIRIPLRIVGLVIDSLKVKLQEPGSLWSAEIGPGTLKKILTEYRKAARPYEAYRNKFEKALKLWIGKTIGKKERMVIFIDDLDRCMPEVGLQVLEALKLYLNIPNLIFVLGVDKKVVEKLVIEHYKKLGLVREKDKDKEETETEREDRLQTERKARQYLSKMFQTEIELAPSEKQISNFFGQHINQIEKRDARLAKSEHKELFKRLILKFSRRNPREVKRQLNNAFIAGAGTEMIDVVESEQLPTFEQGLQLYLIREVLKGYTLIADMINTDLGMRFFNDWSELALRDKESPGASSIEAPEQPRDEKSSLSDDMIAKDSEYKQRKYTQLLSNEDLQALMQIPFSHKLAELMAEISPAVPAEKVVPSVTEKGEEVKEAPASEDYIIIRDAVARHRNKKSDELTDDDYRKTTELDLASSGINDISMLKHLTNLQELYLNYTQVSVIVTLSGLMNLQTLDLSGTKVSDIGALSGLTNLQVLYLSTTQVSDIGALSGHKNLHKLYLSVTQIIDISVLSGLKKLQWLDLRGTRISDISTLSGLKKLQWLSLSDTKVNDIGALSGLTNLQTLYLRGTMITNQQVSELKQALPKLIIYK